MQNTIPATKQNPNQSLVRTSPTDKSPMQNSNNLADGVHPHQPTESKEA
jgi:hypothetical protein